MVTIYGYDEQFFRCVPCINAKKFCDIKGKEYEFISIVNGRNEDGPIFDDAVISELLEKLGKTEKRGLSMPQIFIDGESIGGFSDLKQYKLQ